MRGRFGTACITVSLLAGAAGLALAQDAPAADSSLIGTYWQTQDDKFILQFEGCGQETLCASLVWMLRPLDRDTGQPKVDDRNPVASMHNRPVCGLRLVTGLARETDDRWGNASFYNPDDGNTYRANLRRRDDGGLMMRAYVGVEMLGAALRLRSVPAPTETCDARAAAAMADIDNYMAETPGSPWVAAED